VSLKRQAIDPVICRSRKWERRLGAGGGGFHPFEWFFDANAKRRYLAAQRIELRVQLLVLDTPDHFAERSFKSLQDASDKQGMKRHSWRASVIGSILQAELAGALPYDHRVELGGNVVHAGADVVPQFGSRLQVLHADSGQ
jgi:hypothetical protein